MADHPLFYTHAVPLDRDIHGAARMCQIEDGLGFARASHFVPAVTDEFGHGARELPIVFVPAPGRPAAVFLAGIRPGENLFVDGNRWDGVYMPAYVRRYPFILGEVPGRDPVVCIDDSYPGFDAKGARDGVALFDDKGEPSPFLRQAIDLATNYFAAAKKTEAFVDALTRHGLFRDISAEFKIAGEQVALHGLLAVDEAKLAALPDAVVVELYRAGHLAAIWAHLHSLGNLDRLATRAAARSTVATAEAVGSA